MHGRIALTSEVGKGTTASFWVPFNKPNEDQRASVIQLDTLSSRLQSDTSVSGNSSDIEKLPEGLPPELSEIPLAVARLRQRSLGDRPLPQDDLVPAERAKIHVLVVEDK